MSQQFSNYSSSEQPQQTSALAMVSLISGILGWLGLFGLGGIVAVITGHMAVNEINRSAGRQTGSGIAKAGLVLGYLNIALVVLGICVVLILMLLGLLAIPVFSQ